MIRPAVISIITESPEAHGVFDPRTETATEIKCAVRSITRNEFYQAQSAGILPELVFVMPFWWQYGGQKVFTYNGERWRVIRTYSKGQVVEITAGRATNDRTTVTTGVNV